MNKIEKFLLKNKFIHCEQASRYESICFIFYVFENAVYIYNYKHEFLNKFSFHDESEIEQTIILLSNYI